MSYTNQTQHYGLPQYVGTDVPAWLTDVNGAFATIDQGMNAAKTQADSAATAAGQAANDIVSINSTLGTQAGQISAAANAAAAAQTTANTADNKADTNAQSISGLDTRVTALESGSSSAYVTKRTTLTNIAISAQGGSLYYSSALPDSILPSGKTYDDIVSIAAQGTDASAFPVLLDLHGTPRVQLASSTAITLTSVKIIVTCN